MRNDKGYLKETCIRALFYAEERGRRGNTRFLERKLCKEL